MHMIRALSPTLAFCLLFLPVALCGAAPVEAADCRDVFVKASQNLLNLKSYRLTMVAEGSMTAQDKRMNFAGGGQSDVLQKPLLMKNKLDVTVDDGGRKSVYAMAQYVEQAGDRLAIYTYADNKWTRQVVADPGGGQSDYRKYFDSFLKGITSVKLVRETDDTLVLEAAAGAASLRVGLEKAMSAAVGRQIQLPESLFDELDDFRYTVAIKKDGLLITELSVNLAEFVTSVAQTIIEPLRLPDDQKALAEEILKSVKLRVKISVSRYNAVEPITIPREAKNAPLVAPAKQGPAKGGGE